MQEVRSMGPLDQLVGMIPAYSSCRVLCRSAWCASGDHPLDDGGRTAAPE
jgi:hypothetical protein